MCLLFLSCFLFCLLQRGVPLAVAVHINRKSTYCFLIFFIYFALSFIYFLCYMSVGNNWALVLPVPLIENFRLGDEKRYHVRNLLHPLVTMALASKRLLL